MFTILSKRAAVAAVGVAAAVGALTAGASAASADREPVGASGNTVIQLGSPIVKSLQAGDCGMLSADASGGATVTTTGKGKINFKLPISGIAVNPDNANLRIAHAGSGVHLYNDCYDIRLTNFYVQNFGTTEQDMEFDVSARATPMGEDTTRENIFTLSLENSNLTLTQRGALKVRGADVYMAGDGADAFNQLATGSTEGPFSAGEFVGKARTTVRFQYGPPVAA